MSATISLTQTQIITALGTVLQSFGLTSSTPGQSVAIVRGQVNRVPEPVGTDFIVLWPILRGRLAMNVDTWVDAQIAGSITANVLTVTVLIKGAPAPGQTIYGAGVAAGCQIIRQITGTIGGTGTYATTATPNVASQTLYIGTASAMQETEITIQADVHGPSSADNSQRIQTLFRDQFAVTAFLGINVALSPLYTSDPRQMPFENGEQQTEEMWIIDLCMQADITITTTQQFADQLTITVTDVEAIPA